VCLSDINEKLGEESLRELSQQFGEDMVTFQFCDVTKEDSVKTLIEEAERKLNSSLYCFINNAGVMGEKEGWRLCMDINLTGVLHGTNLAMSKMDSSAGGGGGKIVNIASILGLFCAQQPKGYQYNVSKSSVVTLTRCIGNEFYFSKTGVKVMCLCPSVAKTPILAGCTQSELDKMKEDVGGFMTPQFVADALVKLLDDDLNGSVMAAWNKVPPYYIPDTGMALFIFYTTCAMICRFVPGVRVVRPWMMVFCLLAILSSWYLGGLFIKYSYGALTG